MVRILKKIFELNFRVEKASKNRNLNNIKYVTTDIPYNVASGLVKLLSQR